MGAKIKGGAELSKFLLKFPQRLEKNAVRAALRAGAKPFRDEARRLLHSKSGKLAKAIKIGSPRAEKKGAVTISIAVDGRSPHAYIGHFLEYGVTPHEIDPKNKRALVIGPDLLRTRVHHPGFGPKPFMRPAADTMGAEAVRAFSDRLRDYLKDRTGLDTPDIEVEDD
jgi:HK97 gp10 family phage protein